VVIGGDVAYDNAMPNCYESWDRFLEMVEENLVRENGDLVPIALGIGNHDIGLNSFSQRSLVPSAAGPLFFSLFPQHFLQSSPSVPPISSRLSYFHLLAGPCLLLLLDSGYIVPYSSPQSD
jgi:hypothetical protein